ncbi:MAG: M48 family metallopeptidase [Rhizomicrobium sp.]
MTRPLPWLGLIGIVLLLVSGTAQAQQAGPRAAPVTIIQSHALPPIGAPVTFDPAKATNAYLASVSGAARAQSDSYFEGGYWLILVDTFWAVAVSALLLWTRFSAALRDFAERQTRSAFWQAPLYVGPYILIVTVLSFPLTLYESFLRERAYGLMNQTFFGWFLEFLTVTGVNLILFTIGLTLLYWAIRSAGRTWWIWATGVFAAFFAVVAVIAPVLLAPLTNTYTPLPAGPLKNDILSLARANGIPATDVFLFDASKQSDRISANVSGLFGTTRISLNDNLLNKSSHDEVLAVLGHEMGHYVMNHQVVQLAWLSLVALVTFLFLDGGFTALVGIFGGNWDVRRIDDPAGLPVLAALAAVFLMLATPVLNTITRTMEIQADMYGINAARKPDAFATSVLKLANYRKLDPAPWEEAIFYDHPSGRTRIWEMMRWKAEHLNDPDIKAGPVSPQ